MRNFQCETRSGEDVRRFSADQNVVCRRIILFSSFLIFKSLSLLIRALSDGAFEWRILRVQHASAVRRLEPFRLSDRLLRFEDVPLCAISGRSSTVHRPSVPLFAITGWFIRGFIRRFIPYDSCLVCACDSLRFATIHLPRRTHLEFLKFKCFNY